MTEHLVEVPVVAPRRDPLWLNTETLPAWWRRNFLTVKVPQSLAGDEAAVLKAFHEAYPTQEDIDAAYEAAWKEDDDFHFGRRDD